MISRPSTDADFELLNRSRVPGIEVLRYGGLETGAVPSPYQIIESVPMYRLRRYFPPDSRPGTAPAGPPVLMVHPMMMSADMWDVTREDGAVGILRAAGIATLAPVTAPAASTRTTRSTGSLWSGRRWELPSRSNWIHPLRPRRWRTRWRQVRRLRRQRWWSCAQLGSSMLALPDAGSSTPSTVVKPARSASRDINSGSRSLQATRPPQLLAGAGPSSLVTTRFMGDR